MGLSSTILDLVEVGWRRDRFTGYTLPPRGHTTAVSCVCRALPSSYKDTPAPFGNGSPATFYDQHCMAKMASKIPVVLYQCVYAQYVPAGL